MIKLQYFCPIDDEKGYTHSIDNLIIEYDIKDIGQKGVDKIIKHLQSIKDDYNLKNYWERLNVNPCSKYQWYTNHIHMDTGIYLSIGRFVEHLQDAKKKSFFVYPVVKLEVNPNKHFENPVLQDVLSLLQKEKSDARLRKYDYCIDVPLSPSDVEIFGSRKQQGLYKGTRYFGQRNKNGYCKIYDKAKEQDLDNPLTRIEHTITTTKTTKAVSFENIYVKNLKSVKIKDDKISDTNKCIRDLCLTLKANDLPYEQIINQLDKRKKQTIKELLTGNDFEKLDFDQIIHDRLLKNIKSAFKISEVVTTDDQEFLQLDDNYKNPWDL